MANAVTRLKTALRGSLVGRDAWGNAYYQTKRPRPRGMRPDRWVVYKGMPEASKVPPLYHAWLHHTTDVFPDAEAVQLYAWQLPPQVNLTGTPRAFRPAGALVRAPGGVSDGVSGEAASASGRATPPVLAKAPAPSPAQSYEAWTPETPADPAVDPTSGDAA